MAVPSYTTDLQVFNDFESSYTALEFTNWTAGRTQALDTDYPIQGSQHVSAILASAAQGSIAVAGTAPTWTSGWAFFMWGTFLAPAAIDTKANGGMVMMIGSSTSAYRQYNVGGNDFGSYPYGGWQNFVADPEVTPTVTEGSPTTSYSYIGMGNKTISAVAKGSPQGIDVIRYGRGELRIAGGQSGSYATFEGMASANDANTARWGLFQKIPGGFRFKGLMYLGYGALTAFIDANKAIVIDDTLFVQSSFNAIEVHNASSSISWTNINISALGTVSKGMFSVIDNATVLLDSCTFTDMNSFTFQSNTDVLSCTFRRCGLVTQGSSTITGTLFYNASGAVALAANILGSVTKCTFLSSGTGHAVNLGTISASTSVTWDNIDTGYATQVGTAANRTILVNVASGQTLTINVADTGSTPTYYNTGAGSVSVVAGQKTFAFTVKPAITGYEWRLYSVTVSGSLAGAVELAGEESATSSSQSYNYSYSSDTPVAVQIISANYEESVTYYSLINSNQSVTINLSLEENA